MGLWPWLVGHMFTKRFWKSMKVDGALLTYTRGHRAVMNTHNVGGNSERTKYAGIDEFGNKYYEDFDAYVHQFVMPDPNQRRWVEFNDYFSVHSPNGDKIPPKWHGWLAAQYDDVPAPDSDNFHDPFFQKSHDWNPSDSGFKIYTSRQSNINPRAIEFHKYRVGRYAKQWTPLTKRDQL